MSICIKHFYMGGAKIFDPMLGSGSSRIAAYKMGFDYVGCEINPDYFSKGEEWFKKECLEQPVLEFK